MPRIQIRDIEMYYETHGRSDAEPLILLHGFTGTGHATFEPFLEELGKQYRLFVPDLRGHGRTTNPGGEISHAEFSRDTAAFAMAMDLDRVHFCGYSSGGMQLLFLAREHPDLIQSMTLVSATYTFEEQCKALAREIRASADANRKDNLKALHGETHGSDYADTLLDHWLNSVIRPGELPFTQDDLSAISCPTLIIHGDRDGFFPIHIPVTMYQAFPNSELCILPNCGHGLSVDSFAIFTVALLEFLARNRIEDSNW